MLHSPPARREASPPGVIDTLSAGYAAINRQLWVLVLPIVVDLFLWLGPQVSYSPLVDPALARASQLVSQATRASNGGAQTAETAAAIEQQRQLLIAMTNDTNVLALVATRGPLALPSVTSLLGGVGTFSFVRSWMEGLLLLVAALASGLVLGGLFRGLIAQQVREGRSSPVAATRRLGQDLTRVLALTGVLLAVAALLGLPALVVVSFAALVSPAVAVVGILLILAAALFAEVHLFFAVDAIFVSGVGPLTEIQRSVGVARTALTPTLGLVLLTWLILAGMSRVWELLAAALQPPYGAALGVLGNAYIASGLLAASMIFYKERAGSASGSGPARPH